MNNTATVAPTGSPTLESKAATKNGSKRLIFAMIAIVLQIAAELALLLLLGDYYEWISIAIHIIATILVLAIYNQDKTSAMKVPWIVLIMALPVLGVMLYLFTGFNGKTKKMADRYQAVDDQLFPLLPTNADVEARLAEHDKGAANISRYIHDRSR